MGHIDALSILIFGICVGAIIAVATHYAIHKREKDTESDQ